APRGFRGRSREPQAPGLVLGLWQRDRDAPERDRPLDPHEGPRRPRDRRRIARPWPGLPARFALEPKGVMSQLTTDRVLAALGQVQDPDLHRDLVSLGMIENVAIEGGRVSFRLVLTTAACPLKAQIEDDCKRAVLALEGAREVAIETTSRMRKPG